MTSQLHLQQGSIGFQLTNHFGAVSGSEDTDKDVRIFQIGCDIDVINADERAFEINFPRDDSTELAFDELVNTEKSVFHFKCSCPLYRGASLVAPATPQSAVATCSQFLRSLFELITFDDVAHLIFAEIAELDAAFES